jgi:hypothetical protein
MATRIASSNRIRFFYRVIAGCGMAFVRPSMPGIGRGSY